MKHRNVVRADQLASGLVKVTCVDEHLRYVRFVVPFALSTMEHMVTTMHHVLDDRARRQSWRERGSHL